MNPKNTTPSTGASGEVQVKSEVVPFDKYNIVVELGPNNEFLGVDEVSIDKDFMSYKQKSSTSGYHDVEDLYKDL